MAGATLDDLASFMLQETNALAAEYKRIQARAAEDPGTAGDQGEENWKEILGKWLPPTFQVVTKGRILGADGRTSPQVDVLVLSPHYPKTLLGKKLYLAGGVLAAFECKNTLKASHIADAVQTSVAIRSLLKQRKGSPYRELHSPVLYGVLAHSHGWKSTASKPVENIENRLIEEDRLHVSHPREMIDIFCVADTATWISVKNTFFGPQYLPFTSDFVDKYTADGSPTSAYVQFARETSGQYAGFTPIGLMLKALYRKLAWEESSIRQMADCFGEAKIGGHGGGPMRIWTSDIYSEEIRSRVMTERLPFALSWDEWSMAFA